MAETAIHPALFIPGITGTALADFYRLPAESTWSTWEMVEQRLVATGLDSLALDPAGEVDRSPTTVTRPEQLLSSAYAGVAAGLRGQLGVPVYLAPYDWRLSIRRGAERLLETVKLLRRKPAVVAGWDGRFDVVCHSLGGLVLRAFLGAWLDDGQPASDLPVNQLVFVATPHLGSLDAAEVMIRGEAPLFGGQKQLRTLARTFPSIYELLPRFPGAVVDAAGQTVDVFEVAGWQSNLRPDQGDQDFPVVERHLQAARATLAALPSPLDPRFGLGGKVLSVLGRKPASTLRRVTVAPNGEEGLASWYDFDHAAHGDGDEVVPVESARLPGAPSVEVDWDDVPLLALGARVVSFHAFLPSLDEVQTIVARWFRGRRSAPELLPRGMPDSRLTP